MHIPGGEEEAVRNSDEKVRPDAVVFRKEGEFLLSASLTPQSHLARQLACGLVVGMENAPDP